MVCATVVVADSAQPPAEEHQSGKQLYLKYCAQCHGEKGDGEGYATPHLLPKQPSRNAFVHMIIVAHGAAGLL